MSRLVTLVEAVRELWTVARRTSALLPSDFRQASALLVLRCYGAQAMIEFPHLLNAAGCALVMGDRLVCHSLRSGAARLVAGTRLASVPRAMPALLTSAWLIDVQRPERGERLWGETVSLAGYPTPDGNLCLLGYGAQTQAWVGFWRPRWSGEDLDDMIPVDRASPWIDDVQGHHAWVRRAAEYATAFALLLEARSSPLRHEDRATPVPAQAGRPRDPNVAVVRHVSLDPDVARALAQGDAVERTARIETTAQHGSPPCVTAEDDPVHSVRVCGHLRRVPTGPGRQERTWTWIPSYEATRHGAPRAIVRVGVSPERRP